MGGPFGGDRIPTACGQLGTAETKARLPKRLPGVPPVPADGVRVRERARLVRSAGGHVADGNMPRRVQPADLCAAGKLSRRKRFQDSPRHRRRAVRRQNFDETLRERSPGCILDREQRWRAQHCSGKAISLPQDGSSSAERTAPAPYPFARSFIFVGAPAQGAVSQDARYRSSSGCWRLQRPLLAEPNNWAGFTSLEAPTKSSWRRR